MAYARARRHYRVAQEQAQQTYQRGVFIPDDKKTMVGALIVVAALVVLVKGILLGLFFSRYMD